MGESRSRTEVSAGLAGDHLGGLLGRFLGRPRRHAGVGVAGEGCWWSGPGDPGRLWCCTARWCVRGTPRLIGRCWPRWRSCCPGSGGWLSWSRRRRCCVGIANWSPGGGPIRAPVVSSAVWTRGSLRCGAAGAGELPVVVCADRGGVPQPRRAGLGDFGAADPAPAWSRAGAAAGRADLEPVLARSGERAAGVPPSGRPALSMSSDVATGAADSACAASSGDGVESRYPPQVGSDTAASLDASPTVVEGGAALAQVEDRATRGDRDALRARAGRRPTLPALAGDEVMDASSRPVCAKAPARSTPVPEVASPTHRT